MVQHLPSVPDATPFGIWLRQRRKALDLTQEKLAAAIDVSLPTIVKIEAGERRPSREVAELLARCLKVPAEELPDFMRLARAPLEPQRSRRSTAPARRRPSGPSLPRPSLASRRRSSRATCPPR